MSKLYFVPGVFLLAGLVAAMWYVQRPAQASPEIIAFAKCLRDKGITMYGADWCSHCQNEKAAFGTAFRFVPYVECPKEPKRCLAEGIDAYPTWIFPNPSEATSLGGAEHGGRRLVGEQGIPKLSQEAGCPLPSSKN